MEIERRNPISYKLFLIKPSENIRGLFGIPEFPLLDPVLSPLVLPYT